MSTGLGRRIFREKRPIIIALTLLAIGNAVFFATVVYPLQRRVATADQRAAAAASSLKAAQAEEKLAKDTLVGKERAERELRRFYDEILPSNQSAARRLTYLRLAELAQQTDLQFDHRTFSVEEIRDSSLTRLDITMLLSGAYGNVRNFIHELERANEFVIIRGIELVQREQNNSPLELTIRLATYYRAGDDGR
jgi:hypothetical protein